MEKLKRKEAAEIKKVKVTDALNAMTEEQLATWRAQRAVKVAARNQEKLDKKARMTKALEFGQRIVIDLEFPELMTEGELRSMAHQVSYSYGNNIRTSTPAHLILSGVHGTMRDHLAHGFPGFENWMVTSTEKTYLEHFPNSKTDLIYLTADSPYELQELDPSKIYIVGGIVDRNRHKNLCFNKAVEQGIATARLPIGDTKIKLASSMVMCTNHVVDIMLKWMEMKDWEKAFKAVIPTRKRKASDESDGGEGSREKDRKVDEEGDGDGIEKIEAAKEIN
jgi:tRNA (guanine9-N1)-methyltransferase